jgi:phasin family protein
MENSNNQFFDFMKNAFNPEHMMNSMKATPALDLSSMGDIAKRNAESMTAVNQLAAESLQSIMKRSAEVFQNNASEMMNVIKENSGAKDLEQVRSRQQEFMKSSITSSIDNAKEIMDMTAKSAMEIFEVIGQSMAENVNKAFDKARDVVKERA